MICLPDFKPEFNREDAKLWIRVEFSTRVRAIHLSLLPFTVQDLRENLFTGK